MKGLTADFVSPPDYRNLAVEISYDGQIVCLLERERSPDRLEIRFPGESRLLHDCIELRLPLSEFLKFIEECGDELMSLPDLTGK